MLLVFRLVRKYTTKNTSLLHEFFNKTDKHEILNYFKNLTSYHTSYENLTPSKGSNYSTLKYLKNSPLLLLNFLQSYRIKVIFEYFDVTNRTCQTVSKIDETSVHRSMEKTKVTRRRRRRTNAFHAIAVKTIKKNIKKKKRRYKNKKLMHHFSLNNSLMSQFPPLNGVKIHDGSQQSFENYAQFNVTDADTKSFSDVLKDNSLLHSKGANLKEFIKDVRFDVYTPYGKWLKDSWLDERAKAGALFKVLSYNILSQHLLEMHQYLYLDHDPKYLDWEYRKNALLGEFSDYDADILCLQEVEANKVDFFDAELGKLGYKGIFKKRTNDKEDGCAIYYRTEKFDLKESATVEYNQPYVRLLNRDNIGIIARLSCKENEKNVVVANTHLLFNPNRHDIKLAQLAMLLAEIDRIAFRSQEESYISYHPVILCGDLNLKPFTFAYNLLGEGYVENFTSCFRDRRGTRWPNSNQLIPMHLGITDGCQHYDVIKNRGSRRSEISDFQYVRLYNSDRKSLNSTMTEPEWRRERINLQLFGSNALYHALNLSSVYPQAYPDFGNASTYQDSWCNVDYIFYGPRKMVNGQKEDDELKLVSYLRLPTCSEAEVLKTIPNEVCGSDHLPLMATFHLPNTNGV